MVGMSVR